MKSRYILVGATGNVGRHALHHLLQAGVSPQNIVLVASPSSRGKAFSLDDLTPPWILQEFSQISWQEGDICLLATEDDVSRTYVPYLLESTPAFVADSSAAYRMDPKVPLMVPPLNSHLLSLSQRLYAHANCIAVPVAMTLWPLKSLSLRSLHVTTYQSAAGAGHAAMEELEAHTAAHVNHGPVPSSHCFAQSLAFNAIPLIGSILDRGCSSEEDKIVREIQKILGYTLAIFATSVRIPTLQGHGAALWLQGEKDLSQEAFLQLFHGAAGLNLHKNGGFPTINDALGSSQVQLGRAYKAAPYRFHVWCTSDNLLRGASTDLVETAMALGALWEKAHS